MKKIVLFIAILSIPQLGFSQFKWDFGGSLGASNYLGDIGGKEKTRQNFVADMKLSQTRVAAGGFARYKWKPTISLKTSLNYVRVQGSDALSTNPARFSRNLSFRNNMFELTEVAEWYFYRSSDMSGRPGLRGSKKRVDFRTYLFGGVGVLYHNPQAKNAAGKWVDLRPLRTEDVSYSSVAVVVPLGVGLTYTINRHYRFGFELGWRKTFTDYIDDVSTTYKKEIFENEAKPLPGSKYTTERANMANRNIELGSATTVKAENYGWTEESNGKNLNKRGDDTNNDNYITATVSFSYVIKGKNKFYKQKYKSLSQRRKVVKRKTRAKF